MDPTLKTETKLSQIINRKKDYYAPNKYKQLIQLYTKQPHMYGLSKIYKVGIPLRTIVSCRGSASHPLSRSLVDIVNSLTLKSSSYVSNSEHFLKLVRGAPMHNNRVISLDVVGLFNRVPTS